MIELIKMERPQQFPKDEILNDSERLVRSWMSVDVKDKQGDRIPVEAFKRVLNTWFKRGATMMDQHSNRPIGKGLTWNEDIHTESGKPGIILDWQCFKDYKLDDQVWDEIKTGKREGLSIGGRATEVPKLKENKETGETEKYIPKMELYEVSPVDSPANQLANHMAINYLAKSSGEDPRDIEKALVKDLQKGYVVKEEKSPFGGFGNMEECMVAQEARGHSKDASKRVCTFIQHQTNKDFESDKSIKKADKYNFEEDSDNVAYIGLMVESEEHPQLDEKAAKQLVMDHLEEDPTFYDKQKSEYKKRCKKKEDTTDNTDATDTNEPEPEDTIKPEKLEKEQNDVIKTLMEPIQKKSTDDWPVNFIKMLSKPKDLNGSNANLKNNT